MQAKSKGHKLNLDLSLDLRMSYHLPYHFQHHDLTESLIYKLPIQEKNCTIAVVQFQQVCSVRAYCLRVGDELLI